MRYNNHFIGFFAILMLSAAAVYLTREVASTPEFTTALGPLNGLAGAHATPLALVAAGTIALVGISVLVILPTLGSSVFQCLPLRRFGSQWD